MTRTLLVSMTLAVAAVWHSGTTSAGTNSLSENDLLKLLAGGVYNDRIGSLVRYRGIDFVPTAHDLEQLRHAGADQGLLHQVVTAPHTIPKTAHHPAKLSNHPSDIPPPFVKKSSESTASHGGGTQSTPPDPSNPGVVRRQPGKGERFEFFLALGRWLRSSLAEACGLVVGTGYVESEFKRAG